MSFGKRQLILAALVVSLGAAVYLNWQFGGGGGEVTAVDGSVSDKELGTAQLVNGSPIVSGEESVNTPCFFHIGGTFYANIIGSCSDGCFSGKKIIFLQSVSFPSKTRDEAVELLNQVLNDSEATPEETQESCRRICGYCKKYAIGKQYRKYGEIQGVYGLCCIYPK